tara:strand:+ start:3907 stop:5622 length:1716 start_codon:yes stop_codon:yes gene_type:complete
LGGNTNKLNMNKNIFLHIKKNFKIIDLLNLFDLEGKKNKYPDLSIYVKKNKFIGILTLGDLRRIRKKTSNLYKPAIKYLNKNPITIQNVKDGEKYSTILKKCEKKKLLIERVKYIFKLDKEKNLIEIIDGSKFYNNFFFKKISVIGQGYVGLCLSGHLAKTHTNVLGVDNDINKIKNLKKQRILIKEPNLNVALKTATLNRNLRFASKLESSEIYIVCFGTENNSNQTNNKNLFYFINQLSKNIKKNDLIILRGTLSIGTTKKIADNIEKKTKLQIGKEFYLSYSPERIVEGDAMNELENIPQIVSGVTENCLIQALNFWTNFVKETIKTKNTNEAEIIKLLNNAHRFYSFSFANMTSILAEKYNLNTYDLIGKANYGYSRNPISKPSAGIGGFCLVKDFKILSQSSKLNILESEFKILNEINKIIINTPLRSIKKYEKIKKRKLSKILIFGYAFKGVPQTNDCRNSPGLILSKNLLSNNYQVYLYDNIAKLEDVGSFDKKGLKFINKITQDYINNMDAIIVMNNHEKNEEIISRYLKKQKKNKLFFDSYSQFDSKVLVELNYDYSTLGNN